MNTQKQPLFDWFEALQIAKEENGFDGQRLRTYCIIHVNKIGCKMRSTMITHNYLMELSVEWVTCAFGHYCNSLERNEFGAPVNDFLHTLGLLFNDYIEDINIEYAIKCLRNIEVRSSIELKKIQQNEKT